MATRISETLAARHRGPLLIGADMSTSRGHEWIVASASTTLCEVITGGGTSTGSVAEAFRYDERNDTNTIRYELVLLE